MLDPTHILQNLVDIQNEEIKHLKAENLRLNTVNAELLLALEGTLLGCEAYGLGSHAIAQQARAAIAQAKPADVR